MGTNSYSKSWSKGLSGDKFREGYSGIYYNSEFIKKIVNPLSELSKGNKGPGPLNIADLGSGSGIVGLNALAVVNNKESVVYLVEKDEKQAFGIEDEVKRLGVSKKNYKIIISDLFDISYEDNFFDAILSRLVLHHLDEASNSNFWNFIISKLNNPGIASIYSLVAPSRAVADFISKVYCWRLFKANLAEEKFIATDSYIKNKLSAINGVSFNVTTDLRGPLYVSGKGSIQEKAGLDLTEMAELEEIFDSASIEVKKVCKIKKVENCGCGINTHEFYWPCEHFVIRKEGLI